LKYLRFPELEILLLTSADSMISGFGIAKRWRNRWNGTDFIFL